MLKAQKIRKRTHKVGRDKSEIDEELDGREWGRGLGVGTVHVCVDINVLKRRVENEEGKHRK